MNINELYSRISHEHPKSETAEIVAADNDRSYFNLCQRFLDVALNAEKVIDESGKLVGVFQYSDIDTAKQTAIEFLSTHHIKDIDSFFTILEQYYPLSVSPDEQRLNILTYVPEQVSACFGFFIPPRRPLLPRRRARGR